jgi:hypothetical protein
MPSINHEKILVIVVNTCYPQQTHRVLNVRKPVITYHGYDFPVLDSEAFLSAHMLFRALVLFDEQTTQLFKILIERMSYQ